MVTFRNNNNNNRRPSFRRNDRTFKRNGDGPKFKSDFSSNSSFQRKVPGRNNHNASKLIEKYNDLAREALANNEDKILSENYLQHADHFTRVMNEQEKNRVIKQVNNVDQNISIEKTEEKTEEKKEVSSPEKDEVKKQSISS